MCRRPLRTAACGRAAAVVVIATVMAEAHPEAQHTGSAFASRLPGGLAAECIGLGAALLLVAAAGARRRKSGAKTPPPPEAPRPARERCRSPGRQAGGATASAAELEEDSASASGIVGRDQDIQSDPNTIEARLLAEDTLIDPNTIAARLFAEDDLDASPAADLGGAPARSAPRLFDAGLSEVERGVRQIKSVLNKLTRARFDTLYASLLALCIEAQDSHREQIVEAVAAEVFAKATGQHMLVDLYADLCARLQADLETLRGCGVHFKRTVVSHCQEAFTHYLTPPPCNAELDAEAQFEELMKYKTSMLGNVLLVGHLLQRNLLNSRLVFHCTGQLLETSSPETLETLCVFLATIGRTFDKPDWAGHQKLEAVFAQLGDIRRDTAVLPRIRFLIQDLLDSRAAGWPAPLVSTAQAPQQPAPEAPERCGEGAGEAPAAPADMDSDWRSAPSAARAPCRPPVLAKEASSESVSTAADSPKTTACEEDKDWRSKGMAARAARRPKEVDLASPASSTASTEAMSSAASVSSASEAQEERAAAAAPPQQQQQRRCRGGCGGRSQGGGDSRGGAWAKCSCRILIGIEQESDFQVVGRLIGPKGANMKNIVEKVPDAKIRIRGRGSRFLEGPQQVESTDPLMICVTASRSESFETAATLVEELLRKVQSEYARYCQRRGRPEPMHAVLRE